MAAALRREARSERATGYRGWGRRRIERVRGQRDPFGPAPNPARTYLSSGRASTTTNIGSCRVQPVR
jgi:hypothetical protein